MDAKRILDFLKKLSVNNNREWFLANKDEYMAVRASFEKGVTQAIVRISEFDPSIQHIPVKDATYRFYRDIRFSPDKSPYKTHLGAYICAHGKKSLHGGYYLHLEPEKCVMACGNYWLPTNILTSCRNEIMSNEKEWLHCVTNKKFVDTYGTTENGGWGTDRGFGIEHLKTCPKGFPKDYKYINYLRMKDFCCWKSVSDDFYAGDAWLDEICKNFKIAKPMMDFINNVIDDYE